MSNGSLQDRLYGMSPPNGNLFDFQFIFVIVNYFYMVHCFLIGDASKRRALDWPTRLSIALGSARGKLNLYH